MACDFAFVADAASTEWESKYNALKDIIQLKDKVIEQLKEALARKEVMDSPSAPDCDLCLCLWLSGALSVL